MVWERVCERERENGRCWRMKQASRAKHLETDQCDERMLNLPAGSITRTDGISHTVA